MPSSKDGIMVILSSPSGAGKTTLVNLLSKQNNFEIYVGSENITDYTQENPIINSNTPFDQGFDASMVWAPLMGRTLYFGIRYKID